MSGKLWARDIRDFLKDGLEKRKRSLKTEIRALAEQPRQQKARI